MIPISNQFLSLLGSFLFGVFLITSWLIFNRLFYRQKERIIRIIAEILFFTVQAFLYFFLLLKINFVQINIYLAPFIVLGVVSGYYLFSAWFLSKLELILKKIRLIIIKPVTIYIKKVFAIIKIRFSKFLSKFKIKRKKNGKRRRKNNDNQAETIWQFPSAH